MKKIALFFSSLFCSLCIFAQIPVSLGSGSYASFVPLSESRTNEHGGSQAYQTEHRRLYIVDSLATRPVPTNEWWTYALVNKWTGNLWVYPAVVRAEESGWQVSYPDTWSSDGCEMHWSTTLKITATGFRPTEALLADWSDYHISITTIDGDKQIIATMMQGSPLVWFECRNIVPEISNPDENKYAVFKTQIGNICYLTVGLLTDGINKDEMLNYAFCIPKKTTLSYSYEPQYSTLYTKFHVDVINVAAKSSDKIIHGFLPHHYNNTSANFDYSKPEYKTPRGMMRTAYGSDFEFKYRINGLLPFFPAPASDISGYDINRMTALIADYAAKGSFGADTYWGGKGLEQMAQYMTFAYQIGNIELFNQARNRLKDALVDWFTYTPGEENRYFARYERFGALVGFDPSYDSDTFNDHHFHYGYYTYAAALLCLFDDEFRQQYGQMAREVALDYACWLRNDSRYPWMRTFSPWFGHSFAGGMGNEGNGNGQESSSEAMQSWGGLWLLGAALQDEKMMEAGIFGYTIEARAVAEYWFDRQKRNINFQLYQHPYCCNLTSQGVGWWTWFSGDPVWMHSIQWLPMSPILSNYLSEDLDFARYDYTEMYSKKHIGNYESASGGLGDESGLGNVCLSYLALFDPDSAARVFDDMYEKNKPLARNTDTGGKTYWFIHSQKTYGKRRYDIFANYPLAQAFDNKGQITYIVYNALPVEKDIHFFGAVKDVTFRAPANKLTMFTEKPQLTTLAIEGPDVVEPNSTEYFTIHFFDQYNASYRADSLLVYKAPDNAGTFELQIKYEGLLATKQLLIGEKPYIVSAQIYPQPKYITLGEKVLFSINATDQYGNFYPIEWQQSFVAKEVGEQTISATIDEKNYSHSFVVLPSYQNIALNKPATCSSSENQQAMPASAVNDHNMQTRWGSQHNDGEWIMIDLQKTCFIHHITAHWEAAYPSVYKVEISENNEDWKEVIVTSAGGRESTVIDAHARYVRITGIERATQYGISLYELEIYGIDPSVSPQNLYAIAISSNNNVANLGDELSFKVKGYNLSGEEIDISPVLSVDNGILNDDKIVVNQPGRVTLTATQGEISASYTWIINEVVKVDSINIFPSELTIPIGTFAEFEVNTFNQFGLIEQTKTIKFEGKETGDFIIEGKINNLAANAVVHVVAFAEVNLALNKPTTASSIEGYANLAAYATDGDNNSRWSSEFNDEQWIEIDLLHSYSINRIKLLWETSYATEYNIEISLDGTNYSKVYENKSNKGGLNDNPLSDTDARYVRINCVKRVNQYGFSLFEIEIYGSKINDLPTGITNQTNDIDFKQPIEVFSTDGKWIKTIKAISLDDLKCKLDKNTYILKQSSNSVKIMLNHD